MSSIAVCYHHTEPNFGTWADIAQIINHHRDDLRFQWKCGIAFWIDTNPQQRSIVDFLNRMYNLAPAERY